MNRRGKNCYTIWRFYILIWVNIYLILSLNIVGIFAHGRPEKWKIKSGKFARDNFKFNTRVSRQELRRRIGSNNFFTVTRNSNFHHKNLPDFYFPNRANVFLQRRSDGGENHALYFNPSPLEDLRVSASNVAGGSASSTAKDGRRFHAVRTANPDLIDLSEIPVQPPVLPPQRLSPNSFRRDSKPQRRFIAQNQIRRRPILRSGGHRYRHPPKLQNRQRPDLPNRRVDKYRRPLIPARPFHNPSPRPYTKPPKAFRPPRPFRRPSYDRIQGQKIDASKGSGLANTLLNLMGLKSSQKQPEENPYQSEDGEVNSIDSDYYADYEAGAYYKPKPPTILNRVSKWFEGFKPPPSLLRPGLRRQQQQLDRFQNNGLVDYDNYDTGDDHNLIFYNQKNGTKPPNVPNDNDQTYDFLDVLNSIRNNETRGDILKKVISAAASLSERSTSSPTYVLWTIPTTILAILGLFYLVSAIAILGYQSTLGNGLNNAIGPTLLALTIPFILGIIFVVGRSSINGKLDVQRVMRGDIRHGLSQDFDGVDFALDAAFGSAAILGVGWMASILI